VAKPFLSYLFTATPSSFTTVARHWLAVVLAPHFSIPHVWRTTEDSQCFCPRSCSSSSPPSTAKPNHVIPVCHPSVSASLLASHHEQGLQLFASCPLPPCTTREPSRGILLRLRTICPPRRRWILRPLNQIMPSPFPTSPLQSMCSGA
jgi:hypothetical protein